MTDKFTITLDYDRDEIVNEAKKCIEMGGDIYKTKKFLDIIYPAWDKDQQTACTVELLFRDKDDVFFGVFTEKLAEAIETNAA